MIQEFYVGAYASEKEDGIIKVRADFDGRKMETVKICTGIVNPSWILMNFPKKILYSVNERTPDGGISVFRVEGEELIWVKTMSTGGSDPCHLSLSNDARFLIAANYTSGSLAVFALDDDGIPSRMSDFVEHIGKGLDEVSKKKSHVHFSHWYNGELYTADLGLDAVHHYRLDRGSGKLEEVLPIVRLPEGQGPRHFVFSQEKTCVLYVLCELTSRIFAYKRNEDGWKIIQSIYTLPTGFTGENTAAAIQISANGRYLFVSNRGDDSIVVFKIMNDGTLKFLQNIKTEGKTPRDIQLFGPLGGQKGKKSYIVAANQDSRTLTVLGWNPVRERLEPTGMEMMTGGRPSCILKTPN